MKIYSIGYNGSGQVFFDYLNKKNQYVHSFYFSPTHNFYNNIDWREEKEKFKRFNTYDIEANILFNLNTSLESRDILRSFLNLDNLNLTAVTVLNQTAVNMFKKVKSNLKYHISVNKHISSVEELREQFDLSDIYCINLDYKHIFDLKLMNQIKEQGIKVKIIPNEMCVYGREKFFDKLNKKACSNDGYCHEKCWDVLVGDLEWLNITRQGFTRAFLPYFENKVDIIKLSTRGCPLSIIDNYFMSFISGREDCIFNRYSLPEDKLEEYIKMRFKCSHNCFECLYCKNLFYKYVKEI